MVKVYLIEHENVNGFQSMIILLFAIRLFFIGVSQSFLKLKDCLFFVKAVMGKSVINITK